MKFIVFKGFWTVEDVRNNPDCLWLFGDNDIKRGKGGQAIIRDEPNTFGIPTKKLPSNSDKAFYRDSEFIENRRKIIHAFETLKIIAKKYKAIVLPEAGFGTGLAKLHITAPKTLEFLNHQVERLKYEYKPIQVFP